MLIDIGMINILIYFTRHQINFLSLYSPQPGETLQMIKFQPMKDKKKINQNRAKAKQKQDAKRKQKKVFKNVQVIHRPALSNIQAPEGFKAVSNSQAMMYYAEPVISKNKISGEGNITGLNAAFKVAVSIWNFTNTLIPRSDEEKRNEKSQILELINETLDLEGASPEDFFEIMLQRKNNLFPEEVQPKDAPMYVFQRKIDTFQIEAFDMSKLQIPENRNVEIADSKALLEKLSKLEKSISEEADYDDYEELLFELKKDIIKAFTDWQKAWNIEEIDLENFLFAIEMYFDFTYAYMHEDITSFHKMKERYIEEFFLDFAIRKVMQEASAFPSWTAAIIVFYEFLVDLIYLDKKQAKKIQQYVKDVEPRFLGYLQESN
jgi:hypothetical protein